MDETDPVDALAERLTDARALCALLQDEVLAARLTRLSRLLDEVGATRAGEPAVVPAQRPA